MNSIKNIYLNWLLFALYLVALFTFPITILGSYLGFALGATISLVFLFSLAIKAEEKIEAKLKLESLTVAEEPELYHTLNEFSRRLNIATPNLRLLKSEALTVGAYGLFRNSSYIIVSEGLLKAMNRPQMIALLARELTAIWYGDALLSTWLSRFFSALEFFSFQTQNRRTSHLKKRYSLNWVLSQIVFLPLALIPQFLLLRVRNQVNLSKESLKISHLPLELAESFRKIEASLHRKLFYAPLSLTPLFLVSPTSGDPISRLLFSEKLKQTLLNSLTEPAEQT